MTLKCISGLLIVKVPYDPSCLSVGWMVGWSICSDFLKGLDVTLPCSYALVQICRLMIYAPLFKHSSGAKL